MSQYEVQCECGVVHRGERGPSNRNFRCEDCGASIYVLGRDAWTDFEASSPPDSPSRPTPKSAPTANDLPDEIFDLSDISSDLPPIPGQTQQPGRPPNAKQDTRTGKQAGIPVADAERTSSRRKLPWVIGLIVVVVGVIGWWTFAGRSVDGAERTFVEELNSAEDAIAEGDMLAAEESLQKAVEAAEKLKRTDSRADHARQLQREVIAVNHLISRSPWSLLEEAGEVVDMQGAGDWRDVFESSHQDEWMVMHVPFRRLAGGKIVVDLPLRVGTRDAIWEGDFDAFDAHVPAGEVPSLVVAAQWSKCEPEKGAWRIRLENPFLWKNGSTLKPLRLMETPEWKSYQREQGIKSTDSEAS